MTVISNTTELGRERLVRAFALICLLGMGVIVVAGPSGLIAWGENQRLLVQRQETIRNLQGERDRLHNRVELLDPRHVDPDLAGELVRKELNFAHPDEMVMILH